MARHMIEFNADHSISIAPAFFDALPVSAECILKDGGIFIRPVQSQSAGEFSDLILNDLINQGFTGNDLLQNFKAQSAKIRPAVLAMIAEAEESAKGSPTLDQLFDLGGD